MTKLWIWGISDMTITLRLLFIDFKGISEIDALKSISLQFFNNVLHLLEVERY